MSSTDDRTAVQAKLQVDELESRNDSEHTRLESQMSAGFKAVHRRLDKFGARLGIGAIAITLATILGPTWTTVAASSNRAELREQSAESARQAIDKKIEQFETSYRAECRSRDADLVFVAETAANKTAKLVLIPEDRVTPRN